MNQKEFEDIINKYFESKKYKKALTYTIEEFEKVPDDIVENYVKYLLLLHNGGDDTKKKSKYIEPLSKYIKERLPKMINYVTNAKEINIIEREAIKNFEKEIKKYTNFNYLSSLFTILSKFEINYHKTLNRLENSLTKEPLYNDKINLNTTSIIQTTIESLGKLLILLNEREEKFSAISMTKKNQFVQNIKKVNKKTSSPNKLIEVVNALYFIDTLKRINLESELEINYNDGFVNFVYKNSGEFVRRRISMNRLENFENIENIKFLDVKTEIDLETNYSKVVEINREYESFVHKFDVTSDEYLSVLQETYQKRDYTMYQIIHNNFISNEKLDRKIVLNGKGLDITYNDAIDFYFAVETYSKYYYNSVSYYYETVGNYPITPMSILDRDKIYEVVNQFMRIVRSTEFESKQLDQLIDFYSFGSNNIRDLYYKPLILNNDRIIILPSVFQLNMFHRTFLNHINKIDTSYKDGNKLETYVKETLKKSDFKIYDRESPDLNFVINNSKKGDIDILAKKGKYIFYGQIKNRMNPLDIEDYIAFDRKINKIAIRQLEFADEFLRSNPQHILEELVIDDINNYELIPFVLTNSFYGSGEKRKGISIIDVSSFNMFFNKRDIEITDNDKTIFIKSIFNKDLSVEENFKSFIEEPYFLDEKLFHNLYYGSYMNFGGTFVTLSCARDIQKQGIESSYLWQYTNSQESKTIREQDG